MGPPRVMFHWADSSTLPENTTGDYRENYIALKNHAVIEVASTDTCPKLTVSNTTSFPLIQREGDVAFGIASDGTRVVRPRAVQGLFQLTSMAAAVPRCAGAHDRAPQLAPLGCN